MTNKRREDMKRLEKESFVSSIQGNLQSSSVVIALGRSAGITVAEMTDLRKKINAVGASFKIMKNTLAKIAFKDSLLESMSDQLKGSTALAYSDDAVSVSKVLHEFIKTNDKLSILCGVIDGKMADKSMIEALALLPSMDEIRAKIIGLLTANASKIVRTVKEPGAMIARVVSAKSGS